MAASWAGTRFPSSDISSSTSAWRWLAPIKYASTGTSGLEYEVTEATDSAEFNLTWDGGKPFDEKILGGGD